jgi:predicted transcriptional regulator of viral defense system
MTATSPALIKKSLALLTRQAGLIRLSDALKLGIHRDTVWAMRDQGLVEQVSRGLYRPATAEPLSDPDLTVVSKRVPGAVICLVSALAFHELTTQIPHQVHIALARGRRRPRIEHPPLTAYWWATSALQQGVEKHLRSGVEIRVTSVERSVADAFRYRKQLGLDLAIEALRAWRERRGARPEALLKAARVVHVETVITPYLQAVL